MLGFDAFFDLLNNGIKPFLLRERCYQFRGFRVDNNEVGACRGGAGWLIGRFLLRIIRNIVKRGLGGHGNLLLYFYGTSFIVLYFDRQCNDFIESMKFY